MQTLTETVDFIKANYPQNIVDRNDVDVDARHPIVVARPQFLYRGENDIYEETSSTSWRNKIRKDVNFQEINNWVTGKHFPLGIYLNQNSLYHFLREAIWNISCVTEESPSFGIDESLAGLLQHYGFDTSFIDLTSDIHVAAFFGSFGATPGRIGQIMILPSKTVEYMVFDLSQKDANRPKKQSAYALLLPEGYDLKTRAFYDTYCATWLKFQITQADIEKYNSTELLSVENDLVAEQIVLWYETHIRYNKNVSSDLKLYFQKKIDPLLK